jgi:glycosyltransferase involved in cell wall biosynthesis
MRVLILSESCNPEWPSLPIVAHNACMSIADHADVVVATHIRNKPVLDRTGVGKAKIVYIDNEYIAAPLSKLAKRLRGGTDYAWTLAVAMAWPDQVAFEWEAWKRFKPELQRGEFDVVHRMTPMSPTLPSPMTRWSPVPFIVGPINGGLPWPRGFEAEMRREKEYLRYVRAAYKFLPFYSSTYRKARCILASFKHTIDDLPRDVLDRTIDFPEVGIDPVRFAWPGERPRRERLTFLFAGRLVPYKCADVAIEAFARSPELRRHRLVLVGDGPDRQKLEDLVKTHNLEGTVEILGKVPQAQVGVLMREADVFVFPSVRELGAGAVIEAMACGTVPVVVSYGGPEVLVTDATGVRVPLGTKPQLVEAYQRELERLVANRDKLPAMSRAAYERALKYYTWDAKALKTMEIYEWCLGRRAEKPVFE